MKAIIEQEIPLHKRKKGHKKYVLEYRLTPKAVERKLKEYKEKLESSMEWERYCCRYEKLRDVENALKDIYKRRNGTDYYADYHRDREYRIVVK